MFASYTFSVSLNAIGQGTERNAVAAPTPSLPALTAAPISGGMAPIVPKTAERVCTDNTWPVLCDAWVAAHDLQELVERVRLRRETCRTTPVAT
jgi:hypothetical protein